MGPLITREHRDKVASYIEAGENEGASLVVDGREQVFDNEGFFIGVSLLDHVTTDMSVYKDEIFGPVLSVVRADNYNQAVEMISSNPYGNGAAIFTRDGGTARQFQQDADAGMVGINVPIHGEGRHVYDVEGNRYLDFFGGILTTSLGYDILPSS